MQLAQHRSWADGISSCKTGALLCKFKLFQVWLLKWKNSLTASNSSWRCMWCWMNLTLWMAFSSSKGYLRRCPPSNRRSLPSLCASSAAEKSEKPWPKRLLKPLLSGGGGDVGRMPVAVWRAAADRRSIVSLMVIPDAMSSRSCSGTLISSSFGSLRIKTWK